MTTATRKRIQAVYDRERATTAAWGEYDSAAEWCARRGIKGEAGDALPSHLSTLALEFINDDPDAFEERVSATAYAIAMNRTASEYGETEGGKE